MNTVETISLVGKKSGVKQEDVRKVLSAYVDVVKENIVDEKIPLLDLGVFQPKHQNSRIARNPQDGSVVHVPERIVPNFHFMPSIKKQLICEVD